MRMIPKSRSWFGEARFFEAGLNGLLQIVLRLSRLHAGVQPREFVKFQILQMPVKIVARQ